MRVIRIILLVVLFSISITTTSHAYCGNGIVENNGFPIRQWQGAYSDKASNPTNWIGGIRPFNGETAQLQGSAPIDWDYNWNGAIDFSPYNGVMTITANVTVDSSVGARETCDDGNDDNYDGCTNDCIAEYYGDNIIQHHLGEECDDGNNDYLDGCTPDGQKRYDCLNGKECWVVYNPANGICNIDQYGNADPRVTRYYTIAGGWVPKSTFVELADAQNIRIIWCEGEWYIPEGEIRMYNSHWVGYNPPHIPNISWKHQDNESYIYPPTLLGHLYTGYGENPNVNTIVPQPTDTVMKPQGANQNVLLVKFSGNVIYDRHQYFAGLFITGARGTACFTLGSITVTCDDAAGMRAYCTNGATFEDNIFYDNPVGALVRDTAPSWPFNFTFIHNLFIDNTIDGMRWNYGNSNMAKYNTFLYNHNTHLRIRDGGNHWVWANNFGEQGKYMIRLEAVQYPPTTANQGTMLKWNNFIGNCYSPAWESFFDSCPTCGHWNQNYWKWYLSTNPYSNCHMEDDWDPNILPVEHDMLFEYIEEEC